MINYAKRIIIERLKTKNQNLKVKTVECRYPMVETRISSSLLAKRRVSSVHSSPY